MLTRKNASLLLIAALAASSANLQAQEPDLPLTPYMGGPVELVETQNGTIANKHLLEGIGSGVMVSDAEGRPRIGLGMDEGIPGIALVDEKGAKILAMGGGGEGYGILINDKEEVQRIGLGYKNGDAGIMLYDEKGQYVRGMFRQKDGLNYFSYIDADGKEVFE
jgi:hypothetical protein